MTQPATNRKVMEYKVEPLKKSGHESDVDAIRRTVLENASQGWEIIEACGDEIRMPSLIFAKCEPPHPKDEYLVEVIHHARGENEIDALRTNLLDLNDKGWLLLTVLDYPLSPPVAILRKVTQTPAVPILKVVLTPIGILSQTSKAILDEIGRHDIVENVGIKTVMNSGLSPVLIFTSRDTKEPEDYLVEHTKGILPHPQKLFDLIKKHSEQGWQVCAAFEDETLAPCVIFKRT